MKGVFFRPCPKCGRICNSELDMCEICSGKIAKPEPPKPIIPVVTPVVEPIVEEVAPVVEEQVATEEVIEEVATEEVIEEVATEENIVEETTNEEKQEEVVVPVIETKAPKGKGAKGLYALVAVLMLVIVALVVVIMQDRQPDIAVNNTTLQSNTTTSTTLKQETESTTEITTGTTVDNAGETLAPVTTTKKAQSSNKETTTKKNTSGSTKETTTKTTTTTTEANKVEFNPKVEFKRKTDSYSTSIYDDYYYDYSYEFVDYYIVDSQVRVRCKLTNIREIALCEETFIETSVTEFEKAPVLDAIITGVNYKTFDNSETLYTDSFAFSEDIRNCKVNDIFEMVIYIENEANVSKIVIY